MVHWLTHLELVPQRWRLGGHLQSQDPPDHTLAREVSPHRLRLTYLEGFLCLPSRRLVEDSET